MDCVRSDQHRLHEPAHEGAGGSHHQPQEALQARPQPSHQQVSQKTIFNKKKKKSVSSARVILHANLLFHPFNVKKIFFPELTLISL